MTLLDRVRNRDADGWCRFVDLYGPLIHEWCRQLGLQDADARDVGQEVLRAVSRAVGDFRREKPGDTFRGWLRTITRNKVRDFARRRPPGAAGVGGSTANACLHELAAPPDESDDDAGGATRDTNRVLRRAVELVLADFKEESRRAFLRVVVDGHDPEEVARDLGTSVNAVYLAKSRIKRRLREELAGLLDL